MQVIQQLEKDKDELEKNGADGARQEWLVLLDLCCSSSVRLVVWTSVQCTVTGGAAMCVVHQ